MLLEEPPEGKADKEELRIALAMRGGISLAVWIGGAIAELDLARRGMQEPLGSMDDLEPAERERVDAYRNLLVRLGYPSLSIDVLAGASAGGLNAVIYGFAQSVGVGLEWLRGVWQESGDLWKLFHAQWTPTIPYRTEALLNADENFYGPLLTALELQTEQADSLERTQYLTIDLAATLQSGPPLPDKFTGADLRPRAAHFRFRRTPATGRNFNDIPSGSPDALKRLAYAARATSSFPGAFEPAGVFSWPVNPVEGASPPEGETPFNLRNVFSEVGTRSDQAFDVMDGGVFDNIPIGRAVEAIADAPAGKPTRRILLYLDPSPPLIEPASPARPAVVDGKRLLRAQFVQSVFAAIKYKVTVESSWDDLRDMARARDVTTERKRRRNVYLQSSPDIRNPAPLTLDESKHLVPFRAAADAVRVVKLMTAPGLGFLRAIAPPPVVTEALGLDRADEVVTALEHALKDRPAPTLASDAAALLSAADLFISWTRVFQDRAGAPESLDAAKEQLYRVRTAAQFAVQCRDAAAVVAALNSDLDPRATDPRIVASLVERLAVTLSSPGTPVVGATPIDLTGESGLWAAIESLPTDADMTSLVTAGWASLCDAVNGPDGALLGAAPNPILDSLSDSGERLTPERAQCLVARAAISLGDVGTVVVPDFYTISGDERPLETADLHTVEAEGHRLELVRRAKAQLRSKEPPQSERPAVNATSKLAGNGLANFAGFLATDWRTHDWKWGRADAAAGLIRILSELKPDLAKAQEFDRARQVILPMYAGLDSPKPALSSLPSSRRYALAARLGLGLQRAVWPLTKSGDPGSSATVPERLIAGVLAVVRPALLLIPLLAAPPALVTMLAVAAVQHHVAAIKDEVHWLPSELVIWPLVVMLLAAAAGVFTCSRNRQTWRRLAQGADASERPIANRVRQRITWALIWEVVILVALLLVLGAVAALIAFEIVTPSLPISGFEAWLVAVLVTSFVIWLARWGSARPGGSFLALDRAGWLTLAAGAVAVVAILVSGQIPPVGAQLPIAITVGLVTYLLHHSWAAPFWAGSMAVVSALFTAVIADPGSLGRPSWMEQLPKATQPFVGAVLPFVLAGAIVLALAGWRYASSKLADDGQPVLRAVTAAILLLGTIFGAWKIILAWEGLQAIPAGLTIGLVAAAATTLITPFAEPSPGED